MHIETIVVGMFATNCYLLTDPQTSQAVLIDPGAEADRVIKKVEDKQIKLQYIVNTHCHIDHACEVAQVQKYFNVPFYIHEEEAPLLKMLPEQGRLFGLVVKDTPTVTAYIKDGEVLQFGNMKGRVLHTPGHSPGGISINFDNHLFVGDCLFMDSIGRTDLYRGDYDQLIHSIKTKLLTFDDSVTVYPGHGPSTTIGREKALNPFLI
jgi:hydroxyacylglutathione hydrolase